MESRLFGLFRKYGHVYLLISGLVLLGTKNPSTFFFWGAIALIYCFLGLQNLPATLPFKSFFPEALLMLMIILSQIFSTDPSTSFYPTTQALLFLFLWIILKMKPHSANDGPMLTLTVLILGAATVIRTALQYSEAFHNFNQFMAYGWARTYGYLPVNPSFNAAFMSSSALLLLFPTLKNNAPRWLPLATRGVGVLLVLFVMLGPSRSSLLAFAIGLLYFLWPAVTPKRLIIFLLGVVMVALVTPRQFLERRLRLFEEGYRSKIMMIAVKAMKDRPLSGYGFGNFELAYQKHAFPVDIDRVRFGRTTRFAHNEYLQAGSDLGLMGFLTFLFIVLRLFSRTPPPGQRSTQAGLLAIGVSALNLHVWHVPFLAMWSIVLASAGEGNARLEASAEKSTKIRHHQPFVALALVALLGLSLAKTGLRDRWMKAGDWPLILRWNKTDAEAWQQWGYAQASSQEALVCFSHAARLVPRNPYYHESLARALEATGKTDNCDLAKTHYVQALQYAPSRAINALALGRLMYNGHRFKEAMEWFKAARQIEPFYWECDFWIARSWQALGQRRKAKWVLSYLVKRKRIYDEETVRIRRDIPYFRKDDSDYANQLQRFDMNAIDQELRA